MKRQELKKVRHERRKQHIRKKVSGTPEMPRLTVFRSDKHIYAQVIDDVAGNTIASASTLDKEIQSQLKADIKKLDKSKLVGLLIAKRALEAKITNVAFDRNGYLYHGRVKALADAAREGGLKI